MTDQPITVLIIDDDVVDARQVERILRKIDTWTLRVERRLDPEGAEAAAATLQPDVVVVDFRLGVRSGVELIQTLGRRLPDAGFILLTGQGDEHVAAAAMRAGASDYLLKQELSVEQMERSLRYTLDRLATRKALQASEARFRSVAESASEAIVITDVSGCIVSWNLGAERMFGYGADEVTGVPADILMPAPYAERHRAGMARFVGTGEARVLGTTQVYEGLRKDGSVFPLELSLSSWMVGSERFFSAIIRDISERKRNEEAVQASEARLRAVVETALDCIITMDHRGRVIDFNPAAESVFGIGAEQALGRDLAELIIPPHLRGQHHDGLTHYLETGHGPALNRHLEVTAMRADGSTFPAELSITVVKGGGPPLFTGYLRDITARKEAELALRHALDDVKRSNQDLQQFAYAASHDLQEPLRMVATYLQLLQRHLGDSLDSEGREFIGFAVDGAKRMAAMIQDLIEYSRVSTQGHTLELVAADTALDDALSNLRVAIADAGAEITRGPLPTVMADPVQLSRLFQNLVGNALKYRSKTRTARIRVDAAQQADHNVFSVGDNGIGIEPVHFDRIFAVFQRLHGRQEYEGTGIGLAVCRRIVERHGGHIWVESEGPDRGCRFLFTIPVRPLGP